MMNVMKTITYKEMLLESDLTNVFLNKRFVDFEELKKMKKELKKELCINTIMINTVCKKGYLCGRCKTINKAFDVKR